MKQVIIIAEAGVNHNGSVETAKKLIEVAAESGADYIKFQTFSAVNMVSKNAMKADYQLKNMKKDSDTQLNMLQKYELSYKDHRVLFNYCKKCHIKFLSAPFDLESLDMLLHFGLDVWKIPSGEITNLPYLEKMGSLKKKLIISTGMCSMKEIQDALYILLKNGTKKKDITILHCNTEYPTQMQDVNIKAMLSIKKKLNVDVGYSDHTPGIEIPVAAVALGAAIIEKHFTLDKNMEGPDHKASLEPGELKQMVTAIRNIEQALGDGIKKPSASEMKNIKIVRKSIHLKKDVLKGHILTNEDLVMKRPGDGISPMKMDEVTGKKIKTDLFADHKISFNDIE